MANINSSPNNCNLVQVRGDEIRLSDGRLVGDLLPGLPAIIRAEAIDLLEGHVAYELGFSHGCREAMSLVVPQIKAIIESFIKRIEGGV